MKKTMILTTGLAVMLLLNACNNGAKKDDASSTTTKTETSNGDMSQVRSDIQAIENQWADLQNKKDLNGLLALYSDDAISMQDGGPTLNGKAAIKAQMEKDFAAPPKYASISFQTQDIYGTPDEVTEVGTTSYKDAAGKEIGAGKYMAIFQKKDGKYICIRDIYNKDSK